jgi:hypothetical protein
LTEYWPPSDDELGFSKLAGPSGRVGSDLRGSYASTFVKKKRTHNVSPDLKGGVSDGGDDEESEEALRG